MAAENLASATNVSKLEQFEAGAPENVSNGNVSLLKMFFHGNIFRRDILVDEHSFLIIPQDIFRYTH